MIKNILLPLFLSITLFLTSCAAKPNDNKVPAAVPSADNVITHEDYQLVDERYTIEGHEWLAIVYPQLRGLSDLKKQAAINTLIKEEALKWVHIANADKIIDKLFLEIDYEIVWKSRTLLSIQFSGISFVRRNAYPSNLFYTVNVNLTTGKKVQINDVLDINESFAEQWRMCNWAVGALNADHDSEGLALKHVSSLNHPTPSTNEDIINCFKWGKFYFTPSRLGVSEGVVHALRDHAEFETEYADISTYIKDKNDPIWQGLLTQLDKEDSKAAKFGYQLVKKGYLANKNTKINYPQIKGLKDIAKQEAINQIIKDEALRGIDSYRKAGTLDKLAAQIKYDIVGRSSNFLSIRYLGVGHVDETEATDTWVYTTNIDLVTGKKLQLNDIVNIDGLFIEKWLNYKTAVGALLDKRKIKKARSGIDHEKFVKNMTREQITEYFVHTDNPNENNVAYSYFTNDGLGISVNIKFETNYQKTIPYTMDIKNIKQEHKKDASFEIKYQDIIPYIKDIENPIWRELFALSAEKDNNTDDTGYQLVDEKYIGDDSIIIYPQIKGLSDISKQIAINRLIRDEFLGALDINPRAKIDYDIILKGKNLLTVRYFYDDRSLNIDLNTGRKLQFSDVININESFIEQWQKNKMTKGNFQLGYMVKNARYGFKHENLINKMTKEELITYFNQTSGYFTPYGLGISMNLSNELKLGNNANFEILYQDINNYIKDKNNPIWQGLI